MVTKIKNRVEDNRLFKFLAIQDGEKRIYQEGLSIDTLYNFKMKELIRPYESVFLNHTFLHIQKM